MQRYRIVQGRGNLSISEIFLHLIAFRDANYVQVIYSATPCWLEGCDHSVGTREQTIVGLRRGAPLFVPLLHGSQFDLQKPGLKRVHASVIAFDQVMVFLALAVFTN